MNMKMEKEGEEKEEEKLCPKCGSPYSYIEEREVGNNVYYYAVHYSKTKGKRKKRYCYLGAKDYINVAKVHEDLGLNLHGQIQNNRAIAYLRQILSYFENEAKEEEKEQAISLIKDFLERVS
jgi:hypothetical protein